MPSPAIVVLLDKNYMSQHSRIEPSRAVAWNA